LAADEEGLDPDARARRGATRSIVNGIVLLGSLAVLAGWAWQGLYRLELGESAVVLRFGKLDRIDDLEGLRAHWPPPIEYHEIVNTSGLRTESFGSRASAPDIEEGRLPGDVDEPEIAARMKRDAIQTADSNIVNVAYELQYHVGDAYAFAFGLAEPGPVLHDATEAVVREVVGSRTIGAVLSQDRSEIERDAETLLRGMLDGYFEDIDLVSAFNIDRVNLQKPQAPEEVREAFADVVSAGQDEKRAVSAATGDSREILERARAEAEEIRQAAEAYKQSKIIEAGGESTRFEALLTEYRLAPEVTRRRLYLETMEEILPGIEKMVIEPDTVNMLPMLPLGSRAAPLGGQP